MADKGMHTDKKPVRNTPALLVGFWLRGCGPMISNVGPRTERPQSQCPRFQRMMIADDNSDAKDTAVVKKKDRESYPDRKISETFLHFAEPLLETGGAKITRDQFEKVLRLAFTVWNSVVLDAVNGNSHYVTELKNMSRTMYR